MKPLEFKIIECECGCDFTAQDDVNPNTDWAEIMDYTVQINNDEQKETAIKRAKDILSALKVAKGKTKISINQKMGKGKTITFQYKRERCDAVVEMNGKSLKDSTHVTITCPECGKVAWDVNT